jgi:hypothetical protein
LHKSWKFVSADTLAVLETQKAQFDPRGNYAKLRKLMDSTVSPSEPCLPFLGIIMGDLIHVDEIPSKIDGRLNWHKVEMLAKQMVSE